MATTASVTTLKTPIALNVNGYGKIEGSTRTAKALRIDGEFIILEVSDGKGGARQAKFGTKTRRMAGGTADAGLEISPKDMEKIMKAAAAAAPAPVNVPVTAEEAKSVKVNAEKTAKNGNSRKTNTAAPAPATDAPKTGKTGKTGAVSKSGSTQKASAKSGKVAEKPKSPKAEKVRKMANKPGEGEVQIMVPKGLYDDVLANRLPNTAKLTAVQKRFIAQWQAGVWIKWVHVNLDAETAVVFLKVTETAKAAWDQSGIQGAGYKRGAGRLAETLRQTFGLSGGLDAMGKLDFKSAGASVANLDVKKANAAKQTANDKKAGTPAKTAPAASKTPGKTGAKAAPAAAAKTAPAKTAGKAAKTAPAAKTGKTVKKAGK